MIFWNYFLAYRLRKLGSRIVILHEIQGIPSQFSSFKDFYIDHFQCLHFTPLGFFVYWTEDIELWFKRCTFSLWFYFEFQKNLISPSQNVNIESGPDCNVWFFPCNNFWLGFRPTKFLLSLISAQIFPTVCCITCAVFRKRSFLD